ncbi:transporter substrate-binding domain-containing protein [Vibrio sp. OCN044]|uniref:Transporter substrate-binding domain-containing protein n=1 Tax=Vibrio tetraodonis subsp. pristinus TaxID=2695891 RepID=A0A6L8M302_9VIBR|nr:transporter substrate-binding domain-containing protein [Vibrio tetraodonis]MYM59962.1 transporter substrate-binding domain-containing protein [Vibrio tetraodonis subsp. pristinus]
MLKKYLFFLVFVYPTAVSSEEVSLVRIAMGEIYRDRDRAERYGITLEKDLRSIYKAAGLKTQFSYLPTARAIRSTIDGEYDALDMRIENLAQEKSLLRINVPLAAVNIYLYSIEGKFFNNLEELKDETLVAFHGSRYIKALKSYKRLYLVHNIEQAALMLTNRRATVGIGSEFKYLEIAKQFPDIKVASPPIYQNKLYHYIHRSKAHLLEKIEMSAKAYMRTKPLQQKN